MTDAAARLTPLGVMVLGLLREGDMHPYEMMRTLRYRRDALVPLAAGTFYHTVARLERAGLLVQVGTDRDGNRPERTTYSLTDEGQAVVPEWVRRELGRIDRPVEFRVALAEAHNLPRDEALALLAERRTALQSELERHAARLARADAHAIPPQFLVEVDRQRAMLLAELDWLDAFAARWADTALAWGPHELTPHTIHRLAAHREAPPA